MSSHFDFTLCSNPHYFEYKDLYYKPQNYLTVTTKNTCLHSSVMLFTFCVYECLMNT